MPKAFRRDGPDLKKSSCLLTMTRARRKTVSCLISKARNSSCPSRNALRRYCLSSRLPEPSAINSIYRSFMDRRGRYSEVRITSSTPEGPSSTITSGSR